MHQHTPGPWKSQPCYDDSTGTDQVWSPHRKLSIARVYGVDPYEDGWEVEMAERAECIANARLISAAPELFDALMMALPYVEMFDVLFEWYSDLAEHDDSYKPGVVAKMVQHMTHAIAKATTT